jgi:tetratricopeptide (TPR) repeat protein
VSNDTYALNRKANALRDKGNYTQAIQYYDKVLAIDPNAAYALDGKGNVFSIKAITRKPYNITTRP